MYVTAKDDAILRMADSRPYCVISDIRQFLQGYELLIVHIKLAGTKLLPLTFCYKMTSMKSTNLEVKIF